MGQLTLDPGLAKQLGQLGQIVELLDPSSGRSLGRFVPAVDWSEWEPLSPGVSDEELDRRAKSSEKRYTTAEVLALLQK